MTDEDVRVRLKFVCKLAGSQAAVANAIGVTPAAINAVIRGKRKPHPCILKHLGLKKRVVYVEAAGATAP